MSQQGIPGQEPTTDSPSAIPASNTDHMVEQQLVPAVEAHGDGQGGTSVFVVPGGAGGAGSTTGTIPPTPASEKDVFKTPAAELPNPMNTFARRRSSAAAQGGVPTVASTSKGGAGALAAHTDEHPNMPALHKTLSGQSIPLRTQDHAGMAELVRTITQQSRADQTKKGDAEVQGLPMDREGNFDLDAFLKDAMGTDEEGRARVPREMGVAFKVRSSPAFLF